VGKSSNTQKSTSTTNSSQNQTTTTPGTNYSQALLPQATQLANQNMSGSAFQGDRVAAPQSLGAGNYAAQWTPTPTDIFTQRTTADAPTQAGITQVDPNAQEGIDAGMAAAQLNQQNIPGLVQGGYDRWASILGGQQNPQMDALLARLQQEHTEGAAQNTNAMADVFGAQGAYGGSNMGREMAWLGEQQQQELDGAIASLLYQDYNNNQQMLLQAPEALAAFAGLSGVPAEQYARYGGMRQENLQSQATAADANAQIGLNNQWNQGTLTDQNTQIASNNAMAQREAAHQGEVARVQDVQGQAATTQAQQQAGMDNAYLNWLAQQEFLNNQIGNLGNLIGMGGMVPGSTTSGTGTSTTNSTQTQTQQQAPWQIAAGLGGAALQAFSPGGFFSGGLSALGGGLKTATQAPLPTLPASSPYPLLQMVN